MGPAGRPPTNTVQVLKLKVGHVNLVTFVPNLALNVSSTETARASTTRPCYLPFVHTRFITKSTRFATKLLFTTKDRKSQQMVLKTSKKG